jgi:hypothetical protein
LGKGGQEMKKKYRIHPIFSALIPAALSACDGILFDSRTSCPHCGGNLARYDVKRKHFADVIEGSSTKTIMVVIKRFKCRECHAVIYAHQPFYPNTRIGSPIVDLCVTLSSRMPYAGVATYLQQIGLNVDRWSVRNYAMKSLREIPTTEQYGIVLPASIISLASLTSEIGNGTSISALDVLSACGYPSLRKPEDEFEKTMRDQKREHTKIFTL